ncbi:MAG: HTTM domain-containing protein [Planctomycetota bacterium]
MQLLRDYFRDLFQTTTASWNRFWFTPADAATIGLLRILVGGMILYTHAVWTLGLNAFFGPQAWLNREVVGLMQSDGYQWSHLWLCESPALLWPAHGLALVVCLFFMLGLWTRTTSILTWLITLSYAHRAPEAMYGLDQINGFLALYLAIAPSGNAYSLDRWRATRNQPRPVSPAPASITANIATRLIQVHMCVLYLFAGLSKLQGETWWDGTAIWGAFANLEYQSLDMLWLVHHPWLVNLMTHVTVVWEITYIALIWNRLSRPIVLALAIPVHLGICCCLGMMTFGSIMLIANLAFVSPALVRAILDRRETRDAGHTLRGPKWLKHAPVEPSSKATKSMGRSGS